MNGFDIIVLIIVGVAAVGGFLRGLVQEVLSLAAWALAAAAIYYLHTPLTEALYEYLDVEPATSILAFALLLLIPYAAMKVIANNVGEASRNSILGPIDRVLGFGFGVIKGALIMVFAFSVIALGFDSMWGYKGRPVWITTARTYPVIDSASSDLVNIIAERREKLRQDAEGE
ncbi:CvpA family protein [Altererythrobacter sp.]|uniref:CvpA family protein n=1 Tax=Altererythrobacter sp. TaxID=1872480 RepID=UPI001B1CEFC0|nr:CvpA family protein [Altererythrobacter sp.]MBO6608340.1 CvpA family protein [Altererythrobacter sp.]MBO6641403.1 CvpA family protein [Altererythrobacter sp.]MBO6707899.1 CvpA family protein [Altererythrobacter sp.]MBO6945970.1 CvpA family protein [Altererythrobacter sp.]